MIGGVFNFTAEPCLRPAPDAPPKYHRLPSRASKDVSIREPFSRLRLVMAVVTYLVGCIGWLHTRPLEKESDRVQALALALAESRHELFQLCASLDLEEYFVVVVGDLDVEVLAVGRRGIGRRASVVGHVDVSDELIRMSENDALTQKRGYASRVVL